MASPRKIVDPKTVLKSFKTIVKEAAAAYDCDPHEVNISQFFYFAAGRVTQGDLAILGGYRKVRTWAFGKKDEKRAISETMKALERLAKHAS